MIHLIGLKTTNSIFLKLNRNAKIILVAFFALSLIVNFYHRYHHRAELHFQPSVFDWVLLAFVVLIIANPKGIKLLVLIVFTLLSFVATRELVLFHLSLRHGLTLDVLLRLADLNNVTIYILHMILYICLCALMFLKTNKGNGHELMDQN